MTHLEAIQVLAEMLSRVSEREAQALQVAIAVLAMRAAERRDK